MTADNVMTEARNLRNMVTAQTPFLGEENTPLHTMTDGGTGFESATPRHSVAFTPNPLATPLHQRGLNDPSQTARSEAGSTVGATPVRDSLSINTEDASSGFMDSKRALKLGFASLPKPLNDFEVEIREDEASEVDVEMQVLMEEDAAERNARIKRQQEEEARKALARRSLVVQKSLPRPANVGVTDLLARITVANEEKDPVQQLIDIEFAKLMEHDSVAHPLPGTAHPGGSHSSYVHPEDNAMIAARSAIHNELAKTLGFPDANEEQIKRGINLIIKEEDVDPDAYGWAKIRSSLAFDAQRRIWVGPAELTLDAKIAGLSTLLEEKRKKMTMNANKGAQVEKKLAKLLGGYQARSETLSKRISEAFAELQKVGIDIKSFSRLSVNEHAVGPRRIETLREEVERLEVRERMLQLRYKDLDEDRGEISARVEAKQEALMMSLEEMNEAALLAAGA